MKSTSALKNWVKAGVKTGENEGCCFFVLVKMEDVQGFFEEEQNAMFLSISADVIHLVQNTFDDVVNFLQQDRTGKIVSVRTVRFGKSFST